MDRPPSRATQQAYWDWWNGEYRVGALQRDAELRGRHVLEMLERLALSNPRILEVGCSTGWLSSLLAQHGEVTAIDLSETSIAHAAATVPDVEFIAGDVMQIEFPPASFDVVVTLETIAHVPDQSEFCRRIADVLRPDGVLLLTTQNARIWERSGVLERPPEIIQSLHTRASLEALLEPRFELQEVGTIIPFGRRGIFRILNSGKLNRLVGRVVGHDRLRRAKERMGLGNTIYVRARKRDAAPG